MDSRYVREKGAAYYTTEHSSLVNSQLFDLHPVVGNDTTFLIGEARLTTTLHCAPNRSLQGSEFTLFWQCRQLRFEKSTIPALSPGRSYDVNRSNRISNRCSNSEFIHCTKKMLSSIVVKLTQPQPQVILPRGTLHLHA